MKKYYDIWQHKERKYVYQALLGFEDFKTTFHTDPSYNYINTVKAENAMEAIDNNYASNLSKNKHFICLDTSWIENKHSFEHIKKIWILTVRKELPSIGLIHALSLFKHFAKETGNFTLAEEIRVDSRDFALTKEILSEISEFSIAIHQKHLDPEPNSGFLGFDNLWANCMNKEASKEADHFYNILKLVKPKNKKQVFNLLHDFSNFLENFHFQTPILNKTENEENYLAFIKIFQAYVSSKNSDILMAELNNIKMIKENREYIVV